MGIKGENDLVRRGDVWQAVYFELGPGSKTEALKKVIQKIPVAEE